ncbi:MAG TPA: hypothetical protein VES66_03040 [Terriglobales bacterium]|nr:hypothetical protein [Terriglobales bacterium]
MVVLLPASIVMADATRAMLNATGNVSVNGSPIERATAIFPGDKVQTGPNSMATLTNEGSSVTVPGNSSLVFSRSFVNVLCGTALVSTSRGMSVRVSNLLVQPARGTQARFQITQNEGQLQIIAREGTLAIDNGATTSSLQAGRMLTAPATCMAAPYADDQSSSSPMPQDQPQDQQGKGKRKAPAAAGPPVPGGVTAHNLLLYGAAAGGLAGFLVWLTTRSSASTITP